ncbi:MAG: penicillin-binding transpeptidase domain-containing protein [Limnochordia bacterium]|nr:penicillin-binding transpeptidase domain-containing protein [Limnochordia bacterium]MDD2630396.1 penicillin-binding transpeptidase domain-containing protein [Limnochordia bacterium]
MYQDILLVSRKRIIWLFCAIFLFFSIAVCRLLYVQLLQYQFFQAEGLKQRLRPIPVDAKRGTIYDRNGYVLAKSISASSVYAIPVEVEEPEKSARLLADVLELDYDFVLERLKARTAAEWLKKRVSDEEVLSVRSLDLPGIGIVENPVRYYPDGTIAPQVLGIVGIDNQGLEGIELQYDTLLRGRPGAVLVERDSMGREIPHGVHSYIKPIDGYDIYLTIDRNIQLMAQSEIARVTQETGSKQGLILVMEPNTGEILATAIYPSFDAASYWKYPDRNRRNVAITDNYEPGSTFKAVTAAAALDAGITTLETRYFDPGFIRVSGWTIKCWYSAGHGSQNFIETMENSCNPVYAKLGMQLAELEEGRGFYRYIRDFGFGELSMVDFPGEASGILYSPSPDVPAVSWANMGFGQSISVTPLQLLNAMCAVSNGGNLMKPFYVKTVVDHDGNVIEETDIQVRRQPVSVEAARQASIMLRSAVANGSARHADIPGYRVGGKTGTAQIAEGGVYSRSKVIASFFGIAPMDDPQFAALIVLWEPTGAYYGGVIAAPAFAVFALPMLRYLNVEQKLEDSKEEKQVKVPKVVSLPLSEAQSQVIQAGLSFTVVGTGPIVTDQIPLSDVYVPIGTQVILYTDPSELLETGLTVRDSPIAY